MRRYWRDHSLSLTCIITGAAIMLACIPLREGTAFDLVSGVGVALFGAGLLLLMQGPLNEKNKPEDGCDEGE